MTQPKTEAGGFAKFLAGIVAIVKPKKAKVGDPFGELDRWPGVRRLSEDALDELAYRERVNARAAARRAENARVVDQLLGGRGRWLPFTRGWLHPRSRDERW